LFKERVLEVVDVREVDVDSKQDVQICKSVLSEKKQGTQGVVWQEQNLFGDSFAFAESVPTLIGAIDLALQPLVAQDFAALQQALRHSAILDFVVVGIAVVVAAALWLPRPLISWLSSKHCYLKPSSMSPHEEHRAVESMNVNLPHARPARFWR
jgi:hypothetical protein